MFDQQVNWINTTVRESEQKIKELEKEKEWWNNPLFLKKHVSWADMTVSSDPGTSDPEEGSSVYMEELGRAQYEYVSKKWAHETLLDQRSWRGWRKV